MVAQSCHWVGGNCSPALPQPRGHPQRGPCRVPGAGHVPAVVRGRVRTQPGLRLPQPVPSRPDAQATPGGSICLTHRSETSLSPHPRLSGDGFLPQQFILRAAGLPSQSSAPSLLLCRDPPSTLVTDWPARGFPEPPVPFLLRKHPQHHQPFPAEQENPPRSPTDFLVRAPGTPKRSHNPAAAPEPPPQAAAAEATSAPGTPGTPGRQRRGRGTSRARGEGSDSEVWKRVTGCGSPRVGAGPRGEPSAGRRG